MENEKRQLKRLQVYLASCGIGSRRACEELIAEGRVTVNGETIITQGEKVDPESDVVTFDGKRINETSRQIYIALNKPSGYICTNQDPEGRPLAVDLLGSASKKNRLFSVGRLDLMSSGLILYTNDGSFARMVSHPSSGIEKEYLVETRKPVAAEILDEFRAGIVYNGVRYQISKYSIKSATKVFIVLQEGKNRELRNMFAARRVQVRKIHRIRIGSILLGDLNPGEFRFLPRKEVAALETNKPSVRRRTGSSTQAKPLKPRHARPAPQQDKRGPSTLKDKRGPSTLKDKRGPSTPKDKRGPSTRRGKEGQ